jgi:tRNA (cmo5U34)-methyltransferase
LRERAVLFGVDNSECWRNVGKNPTWLSARSLFRASINASSLCGRFFFRDKLMRGISEGLRENGALILIEKVLGEDSFFNRSFIKYYYEFKKRNGYSELEISQKREALENVLIPYRLKENLEMLEHAGFQCVDVFFKWYNFAGIVAVKR